MKPQLMVKTRGNGQELNLLRILLHLVSKREFDQRPSHAQGIMTFSARASGKIAWAGNITGKRRREDHHVEG